MGKKHSKHTKLKRVDKFNYARLEWAIYGLTCEEFKVFCEAFRKALDPSTKLLLVDADHSDAETQAFYQNGVKQFDLGQRDWNSFDDKFIGLDADICLVNGNHYQASRQIIFCRQARLENIRKRKDQFSRIDYLVYENKTADFAFLPDSEEGIKAPIRNNEQLIEVLCKKCYSTKPELKALVLVGGKSSRMGFEKSQINYHGQTQEDFLLSELAKTGVEAYLSKAKASGKELSGRIIVDSFTGLGPLGAILSAFREDPNAAWLVVACDMPQVDSKAFLQLLAGRDSARMATAMIGEESEFPEPLLCIYEPRAYSRLLQFLSLGISCPRKFLINSDVKRIEVENSLLFNANTQEEMLEFKRHAK